MSLENVSAIILAGGYSSRMGTCKAELMWNGVTLSEHQVRKLRSLGVQDIIICGYARPVPGARYAPDIYPHKGPLSGIHAGLLAAANSHCLVTGIDTPLVPKELLSSLAEAHIRSGSLATVVSHGGHIEPLLGVYERSLSDEAERILCGDNTSVRELLQYAHAAYLPYAGDVRLLCDCNTPEEYADACRLSGT